MCSSDYLNELQRSVVLGGCLSVRRCKSPIAVSVNMNSAVGEAVITCEPPEAASITAAATQAAADPVSVAAANRNLTAAQVQTTQALIRRRNTDSCGVALYLCV